MIEEVVKTIIAFLSIFLIFSITGYLCYIDFRMELAIKHYLKIKEKYELRRIKRD